LRTCKWTCAIGGVSPDLTLNEIAFAVLSGIQELIGAQSMSIHGLLVITATLGADSAPHLKAVVTCFQYKLDSGASCSGACFQPDGTLMRTGKMTCGHRGKVSDIEWTFVERRGDKDLYKFTRRFPVNAGSPSTTSKVVEYTGNRVIIFKDKWQVIVIEPPSQAR
jgi:hypothetical protein